MLRHIFIFLLCTGSLTLAAQKKQPHVNYAKEGYVKAKVIKYEVESCGYLLQLGDKKKTKLAPDKLPDDFKKHNMKVWVKYVPVKKPMMGTCMAGQQSEIQAICPRK